MPSGGARDLVRFLDYAPDADPTVPGVITACAAIVPSVKGFKGAPSPVTTALPALAAAAKGAASVVKRDDTTRMFAGTAANLYEAASSSWTDRTPTGVGQTLNGLGTSDRWRFAQFQDTTLATAKTEVPVQLAGGATFAKVTTNAPKCGIIETVNDFVMAFDVNDQGAIFDSADRPDGWWCAAKDGFSSWVPSITTEAATGTLTSSPGKIVGGRRFGYQVVAYKRTSMYIGTYVGQPDIWRFDLIPGQVGALSHEAVLNVGTDEQPKHIFMSWDNFYAFDGGRPVPIGNAVREQVYGELNMAFYYAAMGLRDAVNKRSYFFYSTTNSANPDKCVVYNEVTGKWGRDDRQVESVIDYVAPGTTYDGLGALFATYDALPSTSYDESFVSANNPIAAIFNMSHVLQTLTGVTAVSSITTGDYGDEKYFSTLSRVRPRFLTAPSSATLTNAYRNVLSAALTNDTARTLASGRFDLERSARWHRMTFAMTGNHEITGFAPDILPDGEE